MSTILLPVLAVVVFVGLYLAVKHDDDEREAHVRSLAMYRERARRQQPRPDPAHCGRMPRKPIPVQLLREVPRD